MKQKKLIVIIAFVLLLTVLGVLLVPILTNNPMVEMIYVNGGPFSTGVGTSKTTVSIPDLYVGKFEITNQEVARVYSWALKNKKVVVKTNHIYIDPIYKPYFTDIHMLVDLAPKEAGLIYTGTEFQAKPGMEKDPAIYIGWYGATFFCNFLSEMEGLKPSYDILEWTIKPGTNGYRLPTFEEWEYLARGGQKSGGYTYAGSNNPDEVAWTSYNSEGKPHQVGMKKPNELGLFDMSGNVNEFTNEIMGPLKNTSGQNDIIFEFHNWRSGSFDLPPCDVTYYIQNADRPEYFNPFSNVGFRIVRNK